MMVTIPRILTCSNDRTVCLLSLAPGTMRATLECRLCGHHGTVCSVAAKDDKVLTGSVDKTVKLWTVQQGVDNRILHTFTGHYKRVRIGDFHFCVLYFSSYYPLFLLWRFPHEFSFQIPHFLSSLLLSLLYQSSTLSIISCSQFSFVLTSLSTFRYIHLLFCGAADKIISQISNFI